MFFNFKSIVFNLRQFKSFKVGSSQFQITSVNLSKIKSIPFTLSNFKLFYVNCGQFKFNQIHLGHFKSI